MDQRQNIKDLSIKGKGSQVCIEYKFIYHIEYNFRYDFDLQKLLKLNLRGLRKLLVVVLGLCKLLLANAGSWSLQAASGSILNQQQLFVKKKTIIPNR